MALSILAAVAGVLRWDRVQRAMRRSQTLPATRVPWLLAAGLALVASATLVLLGFVDR